MTRISASVINVVSKGGATVDPRLPVWWNARPHKGHQLYPKNADQVSSPDLAFGLIWQAIHQIAHHPYYCGFLGLWSYTSHQSQEYCDLSGIDAESSAGATQLGLHRSNVLVGVIPA